VSVADARGDFLLGARERGLIPLRGERTIERNLSRAQLSALARDIEPARHLGAARVGQRLEAINKRIARRGKGPVKKHIVLQLRGNQRKSGQRRLALDIDPSVAERLRERLQRLRGD
jgi:hypothetical protein